MPHRVTSVNLQIHTDGKSDAIVLQQEASNWFWRDFLPEMEGILDEVIPQDELWQIPVLNLTAENLKHSNWRAALIEELLKALRVQLTKASSNTKSEDTPELRRINPVEHHFNAWLYFLEHGVLPPDYADSEEKTRLDAALEWVSTQSAAVIAWRKLIQRRGLILHRLVNQHNTAFLLKLTAALGGKNAEAYLIIQKELFQLFDNQEFVQCLNKWLEAQNKQPIILEPLAWSPKMAEALVWEILFGQLAQSGNLPEFQEVAESSFEAAFVMRMGQTFASVLAGMPSVPDKKQAETPSVKVQGIREAEERMELVLSAYTAFKSLLHRKRIGQQSIEKKSKTKKLRLDTDRKSQMGLQLDKQGNVGLEEKQPYFIQDAGIVLLHPFLPTLFASGNFLQDGIFISEDARMKAVQWLYYLGSGSTDFAEYNIVLPKLLCAMPLDQVLLRENLLSETELEEGEKLLQSVISHWTAVGNISSAGLREGFLRRDGKLNQNENAWELIVESKTLDILLQRMPWGLGPVKLKWMPQMLHVNWNY